MTRGAPAAGGDDLRRRSETLIRKTFPFAYCDACLALRCAASLEEIAAALAPLNGEVLVRTRRACYGCGRTLELSALRDGPPRP
jgi:hypothetical protein